MGPTATLEPAPDLAVAVERKLAKVGLFGNGVGAMVVALFLLVSPDSLTDDELDRVVAIVTPIFIVYLGSTLLAGRLWARRRSRPIRDWLCSGRESTEEIRAQVLRQPAEFVFTAACFWCGAAVLFPVLIATISPLTAIPAVLTILLGALTACALQYMLVERVLRPVIARALHDSPPPESRALG